ncbi:MAG TPA: hypothetical protein VGV38_04830 [Pyrinomonadaceae bacterium]|nr:hypothetical protein [Pyrinomonadaceae bacterium]
MFEFVVGTLLLLLGWLCLNQASQGRRPGGRTPLTRPDSEGQPMTFRATLGLLLILKGAALIALGIFSRGHAAGGPISF